MPSSPALLPALLVLALSATAQATDTGLALAQKNNCLACHAVDHKVVGPAYRDVAARYAGQPGAAAQLRAKIKQGGGGSWGPIPMPPNPQVSEQDLDTLVSWVLKQK